MGEQSGVFYNLDSRIIYQKEQTLNYFPDYQKAEIIWFKTVSVYKKVTRKQSVWIERKKQNFGLGFIPETGMRANDPIGNCSLWLLYAPWFIFVSGWCNDVIVFFSIFCYFLHGCLLLVFISRFHIIFCSLLNFLLSKYSIFILPRYFFQAFFFAFFTFRHIFPNTLNLSQWTLVLLFSLCLNGK